MVQNGAYFFPEMSRDLTGRHVSAKSGRNAALPLMRCFGGNYTMSSVDTTSSPPTVSAERKSWETPVVIIASTQRDTLSTINTGGIDGTTSGSPVGS
jgi:hypothetical protein